MQKLYKYAQQELKNYDGSHDIIHAERVASNVLKIASGEVKLSCIAGFFHDVCDPKYVSKHESTRKLSTFLNTQFQDTEVKQIIDAIINISYTKLKNEGAPILDETAYKIWRNVSDADMMEAMGITGCIRTLMYQGRKENDLKKALNYIQYELSTCHKYMVSSLAVQESLLRKKSMEKFVKDAKCDCHIIEIANSIMSDGNEMKSFEYVVNTRIIENNIDWMVYELKREFDF